MTSDARPPQEELDSFSFCGQRARPRRGIEAKFKEGETYLKPPGSCKSRWTQSSIGIEVECCDRCNIYVLDVTEQVQIADCRDCRIIVGPTVGSVFLLDCTGCTFSIAARQLRLRDVQDSELRVFVPTAEGVVVESSKRLRFRSWDVAYPQLESQFTLARFPTANNFWHKIYDFTSPAEGEPQNYEIIPVEEQASTRWCELSLSPSGLCSGTVVETLVEAPSMHGCECPVESADGTTYSASWYTPKEEHQEPTPSEPALAPASSAMQTRVAPLADPPATPTDRGLAAYVAQLVAAVRMFFGLAPPSKATAQSGGATSGSLSSVCTLQ
eukprot:CAMPEP_0119299856 /NCGR_PEP_ID=MMETSP1333-20130426/1861_1 /TAXON_ID=418940 /ORGANISM="Scyphosphaera apsteinii, Strain RCC1455" /LENGTH=326 /DNA_ID=CAMNT_0007301431 /DNA_START=29 /DNA_END=1009 /DNA_ORIENTATION=-